MCINCDSVYTVNNVYTRVCTPGCLWSQRRAPFFRPISQAPPRPSSKPRRQSTHCLRHSNPQAVLSQWVPLPQKRLKMFKV